MNLLHVTLLLLGIALLFALYLSEPTEQKQEDEADESKTNLSPMP